MQMAIRLKTLKRGAHSQSIATAIESNQFQSQRGVYSILFNK